MVPVNCQLPTDLERLAADDVEELVLLVRGLLGSVRLLQGVEGCRAGSRQAEIGTRRAHKRGYGDIGSEAGRQGSTRMMTCRGKLCGIPSTVTSLPSLPVLPSQPAWLQLPWPGLLWPAV